MKQAKLSCHPNITYEGDGPLKVKLAGCAGPPLELEP